MNAKNAGFVGLALVGILATIIGLYIGYLWIGSGAVLMLLGALVLLVAGVTLTVIGFSAD